MGRNKMIAKSCPKCDQQVAVATKSCKCGHAFFSSRSRAAINNSNNVNTTNPNGEERRRTGRVRRTRPHFYDSQDYQRQRRKPPKRRTASQGSYDEDAKDFKDNGKDGTTAQRGARRRGLKIKTTGNEARIPKPPPEPVLDPAVLLRCSTFLQEINRKMGSVTWSPD